MSTQNICIRRERRKILCGYPLLSVAMSFRRKLEEIKRLLSVSVSGKGQLSVSGERMCTILVNHLEDLASPVNVWLGK